MGELPIRSYGGRFVCLYHVRMGLSVYLWWFLGFALLLRQFVRNLQFCKVHENEISQYYGIFMDFTLLLFYSLITDCSLSVWGLT